MSGFVETDDRLARWVAMWQEAVRSSDQAMALAELSTTRFVELSPKAAELLGTTPEDGVGVEYLSFAERPQEAAETFRLAREGLLDGIRARRRFRRPDGSTVDVESWGWVIRSHAGRDLGLWVAGEVRSGTEHAPVVEEVVASPAWHAGSEVDSARVTLDDHWRMTEISTTAGALLGRSPPDLLGTSIIELSHPDDVATLLLGFARATTEASARTCVRLRHHDGSWRAVEAAPTVLDGDGTSPFTVVVSTNADVGAPHGNDAASELAGDLRRIADTIEAAGILAPLVQTADALGVSATTELSPRQWEVVSRLVRGERVATIAAEMYLSQSTVRNHLSGIFHKVGVHSQHELLALWRRDRPSGPLLKQGCAE
jgi:PAS domain S-box-containing protein